MIFVDVGYRFFSIIFNDFDVDIFDNRDFDYFVRRRPDILDPSISRRISPLPPAEKDSRRRRKNVARREPAEFT
jgi:hypothetical protein